MDVRDLENIDADAPIFDPQAFGLGDQEAELNALARSTGRSRFAPRASEYDRGARGAYASLARPGGLGSRRGAPLEARSSLRAQTIRVAPSSFERQPPGMRGDQLVDRFRPP